MWILIIFSLIITILSFDLSYNTYELNYSHWKKKQRNQGLSSTKEFYRKEIGPEILSKLSRIIPGVNLCVYIYDLYTCATYEFEYSSKSILYDLRSRNKGINAKLLHICWTPKKSSKRDNLYRKSLKE